MPWAVTVLVGVRCTDGAVIGADSIATSSVGQMPLIQIQFDGKIRIFGERVIVATTGAIGFSQRLHQHVEAAVNGNVFRNFDTRRCTTNITSRFIGDLTESKVFNHPSEGIRFGALIAAACAEGPFLAEFATTDFQPEIKSPELFFVTMGSGQLLADPFIAFVSKVLWQGRECRPSTKGSLGRIGSSHTLFGSRPAR
jgi:20S proteasome alpha/beta subunit